MIKKKKNSKFKNLIIKIQHIGKDKWFDLLKPAVPVVIAGIFGTCIAHHYQSLDANKIIFKESRDAATKLSLDVTDSLSQRRFYAIRATIAFQFHTNEVETYTEYDRHIKDWNDKLSSNLILIKRYFGEQRVKDLAIIITKMNKVHQELLHAKNVFLANQPIPLSILASQPMPDLTPTLKALYALDKDVSDFGDALQEQLQTSHVDIYNPKPSLQPPKN